MRSIERSVPIKTTTITMTISTKRAMTISAIKTCRMLNRCYNMMHFSWNDFYFFVYYWFMVGYLGYDWYMVGYLGYMMGYLGYMYWGVMITRVSPSVSI